MAATEIRDRRRTLRHQHLLVRQMVQMKNRISGPLMETGVSYNIRDVAAAGGIHCHDVGIWKTIKSGRQCVTPVFHRAGSSSRWIAHAAQLEFHITFGQYPADLASTYLNFVALRPFFYPSSLAAPVP